MKARIGVLAVVLMGCVWFAVAGCSAPVASGNGGKDVCTGDRCGQPDGQDALTGEPQEEPAPVDVEREEVPGEEIICDECEEEQIKCTAADKYRTCQQDDEGCWKWSPKTACGGENDLCVCPLDKDGGVCVPADGLACVCQKQCDGKVCGPDGCGGECNTCLENEFCSDDGTECIKVGECECPEGVSNCEEGEKQCNGELIAECRNIWADNPVCTQDEACWVFADAAECPASMTCQFDECACAVGMITCGDLCCAGDEVCFGGACEKPDCEDKECGSDGAGGTCGDCPCPECDPAFLICNPETFLCQEDCVEDACTEGQTVCTASENGFYDCVHPKAPCETTWAWNTLATACETGEKCEDGVCVCVPQCDGKECGDDGCDGICGECPFGKSCTEDGTCGCVCTPDYFPVCHMSSGKTYANWCLAECEGLVVDEANECKKPDQYCKGECPGCEDLCPIEWTEGPAVCGTDGNTYENFCDLYCNLAMENPDCKEIGDCPQIMYMGGCKPPICEGCPDKLDPLCGTDGKTYYNKCSWQMCYPTCSSCKPEDEGCQNPCEPVDLHCQGACLDAAKCPDATDVCEPVCGLLGGATFKTYMNAQLMECEGAEKIADGSCCLECANVDAWVCSQGFHAYKNDCVLLCQNPDEAPELYLIPVGPDGDPLLFMCEDCQADLSEAAKAQVCGDDYQTYHNLDALTCAAEQFQTVSATPECEGPCTFENCPCPPLTGGLIIQSESVNAAPGDTGQRGVCGADGNTYGNECSAAYFGTYVVDEKWCDTCAALCADEPYVPICCEDGVTYPNSCIPQKCNTAIDFATCGKGTCCLTEVECDDEDPATKDICNNGVCENQ